MKCQLGMLLCFLVLLSCSRSKNGAEDRALLNSNILASSSSDPIPPGNNSDGDTGFIPGPEDTPVDLMGIRICSIARSRTTQPFVEDLKSPILSIEVHKNGGTHPRNSWITTCAADADVVRISTLDLTGIDFDKPLVLKAVANYSSLKEAFPKTWGELTVTACVREKNSNTAASPDVTQATTLSNLDRTKAMNFSVFANRWKTKAANPDLCDTQRSPLVLRFGERVKTLSAQDGPWFSMDGIGPAKKTGWIVGTDAAFLVWDRNQNGRIDDGRELFGNFTPMRDGTPAPNGFAALKDWDDNSDDAISPTDTIWKNLRLWFDKNSNGLTERGELTTLEARGVVSIDLNYVSMAESENGNQTRQRAIYRRNVGRSLVSDLIFDIWFGDLGD